MTQAERSAAARRPDADSITELQARLGAVRRRLDADARTRRRRGPTWSTLPGGGAGDPRCRSRCSTASTRCTATATCSAPRSSRTTSASAPPATRDLVERIEHDHRRGDPRDRPAVDVRALRLRRPRRPLGPHLRELRRGPGAGRAGSETAIDGFQGTRPATATGCWPPPSTTPATATPSTAPATGDYTIDQGIAVTSRAGLLARSRCAVRARGAEARRRHRDAVVLQRRLDRGRRRQPGQDARQPAS